MVGESLSELRDQAVLGQVTMALLIGMKDAGQPEYEEYAKLAGVGSNEKISSIGDKDKAILLKAYKELPLLALEAFKKAPEVVEILGINLEDDSDSSEL